MLVNLFSLHSSNRGADDIDCCFYSSFEAAVANIEFILELEIKI
ncbi:hypothetical protein EVA_06497 [gut metagenome]|uniref:Uncharacterized protein n=1 Tax=gut metagenome TaxID=749906 RepID=J9GDH2_9ZZZZ